MLVIFFKTYIVTALVLGFYLVVRSRSFEKMSLWKKAVVLAISPLLISYEVSKNIARRREYVKNRKEK